MNRQEWVAAFLCFCLLVLISITVGKTSCPSIVSVKMGSSPSISCKCDPTSIDFYWYKGPASNNDLVCKVYNGTKSVSAKYREYFDVSDSGALILLNATLQHEFLYTLVTFDLDGIPQEASVLVNITVSPNPPCLVISGCNPCESCYLSVSEKSGTLVCSVSGSRPSVPLNWTIKSHAGISFIKHQINEKEGPTKHTGSTSVILEYEITESCGVKGVLQCEAENNLQILESYVTSVEINSELCTPDRPVVLIIVLLVIAITLCFLIGCYIYNRRKKEDRAKRIIVAHQGVNRETLVRALALFYEKFCSLKPLPWGEPIPISALYSDFQCEVTSIQSTEYTPRQNHDLETITCSEDLFASNSFKNVSRVIFIGDLGYGKTTMTQQVVQQWIKEDSRNFILIYIQLKEVDVDTSITSVVKDMMPSSMNASEDAIEKVLKENEVLVLLDGLDELSMSVAKDVCERDEIDDGSSMVKSNNGTTNSEFARNSVIIGDLLKENVRSLNSQMRVWVTSKEVDDMKSSFPPPYVKIKMTGLSSEQVYAYIRKTCQYYCHSVKESNPESTKAMIENVVKKVRENIVKDDIMQEFVNTPLLLVLIIHILTATFTGTVTYFKDLKLTKLTTLIRTVITCLESRYIEKMQDSSLDSKIEEIERKLGEIAWKKKLEIENFDRKGWNKLLGTEYVNTGLSIGLLRLSKQISNSYLQTKQLPFSSPDVEFYHQFFLECLAGQYFSTEEKAMKDLEKFVNENKDDKTLIFLQFMSGSGHPAVNQVSRMFLNDSKTRNNFIDFIYETEDQEKVKSYLKGLSRKAEELGNNLVVDFKYLDRGYHQNAVSAFCESLNRFNIRTKAFTFTFRQDCPLKYLTKLNLPQLKRLELVAVHITEYDFVSILEWLSRQKLPKTFQFTKCTFEENLSEDSKQKIKTSLEGKKLKIYRKESTSQKGITVDHFIVEKGEWNLKFFPKGQ
ncbi:hypothetical protein HOLleu_22148 [Holothuria leucospilota]|uniref:Uncharacterized protein n=1 Tax=Holothuria leucospilota TaxID=206669 RepID=A0A9Q1BXB4_HOLLE|nr:hypothetical protein HOLleu_22148 [Holothuria leucospilota]